jgi:hypothetical protein
MVISKGVNIKTAAKWHTKGWEGGDITLGAGDAFKVLSTDIQGTLNLLPNESMSGNRVQPIFTGGAKDASGSIELYAKYDGLDLLVAMAMGECGDPSVHGVGSGPMGYYNWYTMRSALSGLYMTFGIDREVEVQAIDAAKVASMTIRGNAGERVNFAFEIMGREALQNSARNPANSGDNWTEPTPIEFIMFKDGIFMANAQSGAALDGDDQFYAQSFELTLNNALVADITSLNDPYMDEPDTSGWTEVTGSFTLPRFENNTFDTNYLNGTAMKVGIVFTDENQIGGVGSGNYYYQFRIWLPQVQITEAPRGVAGPEKIPGTFNWVATKPESAPTGFDGSGSLEANSRHTAIGQPAPWRNSLTEAIILEVMNTNSVKPLNRDF